MNYPLNDKKLSLITGKYSSFFLTDMCNLMKNSCMKGMMKLSLTRLSLFAACFTASFAVSCTNKSQDEVIRTRYYHPYGPELTPTKWDEQGQTGEVVEHFKSGIEVRRSYADGKLHGATTWSFPHSSVIHRFEEYEHGERVAFGINYENGTPQIQEELYPNGLRVIRTWYEDGSPRQVEEWNNSNLMEGKYFTDHGDVEAVVQGGKGTRVERSRTGGLQVREQIIQGQVAVREEFYPNGTVKYTCTFKDGIKNGLSHSYTENGQPIKIEQWTNGVLDGTQIMFDHGLQVAQIPYKAGMKEGVELRFKPGTDQVVAKISWHKDMRHGPSIFFFPDQEITEWFWKDGKVTKDQFEAKNKLYQLSKAPQ